MTLHEKLAEGRARLVAAGSPAADARIDVDLFARRILAWEHARLIAELHRDHPENLEPQFSEWVERRARREPAAYITGVREFFGLEFQVTPAVLIPRPETEFIIEESLPLVRAFTSPRIADIGTGSGCLGVTLAHELPDASVVASDLSDDALRVAAANATAHGVVSRIEFVHTSYLDGVDGSFDLIVSNPPYVRDGDRSALSADVRHEPEVALFGGGDGLRDVAGVLDTAVRKVRPGGWFLMEFGYGQEDGVQALVDARPALRLERIRADLQGIPRTAIIERQ